MTYTFKLSRRLAQAHFVFMLACLALLFACSSSDLTDSSNINDPAITGIDITPRRVVLEPNQLLSLKSLRHGASTLDYTTSGGTISPDGVFSASKAGTYTVVGKHRHGVHGGSDTTIIVVNPTPTVLVGLTASPDSVNLATAHTQLFTAMGTLSDGSHIEVPVTWTATGGAIDAGGLYTAGTTVGTFRVIAQSVSATIADTATVTIAVNAPTVTAVVISPATASIPLGTSKLYTTVDKLSDGTTVPGTFSYRATGGTVTSDGLYTPGSAPGQFQVIATLQGGTLSDTAQITVTDTVTAPPPPSPPPPSTCARTVNVTTASGLSSAAGNAQAGDCIMIAAGTYSMPTQTWTKSGTASQPITLQGVGSATVLTTGSNGGIYLKASYWHIRKLRVTNGFFGIQTEGSAYTEIDSVEVDHMQQAGINLRYGTNHSTVKNSKIHDTGIATPKWGEGVYVGGYACEGCTTADNLADDNAVLNSTFWNNGAESIDLSDGADRLTVVGNTINGAGTASIYGQTNSLIGVRGNGHIITDNVLSNGAPYGIDQYNGSATYRRNTITDATLGINISGGTATVYCDNQATASVTCTP
jgi:hypothetical protein